MSKQKAPALTASKAVGKNDFSPISGIKILQIYSICGNSAYYATESGIKGALSAVHSGF